MGQVYYSVRVTYEEEVISDIWYFYLDRETFELKGYRFQHNVEAHDGEYVALHDVIEYNGMKIPKSRAWYVNRTEEYLGTDELLAIQPL